MPLWNPKTNSAMDKKIPLTLCLLLAALPLMAQMERERVETEPYVSETFWTPGLVSTGTVEQLPAGNLNVSILHTFGVVSNRTLQNFFGLDINPTVRLGLDVGLTERWSLGIGRTSTSQAVDLRTKLALMRQTRDGDNPLSISLKGDLGVITAQNRRPFSDDLTGMSSLILARKFGDTFSLQLSPMLSWFQTPLQGNDSTQYGLGIGAEYRFSQRYALFMEYLPVFGDRARGAQDPFSVGLSIETGGHVFQLFLSSTRWHTEQYAISHTNTDFWAGDFRFGFNVNRVFQIGN